MHFWVACTWFLDLMNYAIDFPKSSWLILSTMGALLFHKSSYFIFCGGGRKVERWMSNWNVN